MDGIRFEPVPCSPSVLEPENRQPGDSRARRMAGGEGSVTQGQVLMVLLVVTASAIVSRLEDPARWIITVLLWAGLGLMFYSGRRR